MALFRRKKKKNAALPNPYPFLPPAVIVEHDLCKDECIFFNALLEQAQDLPHDFRLNRSSKNVPFNVTYNGGGYVGKIKLYLPPPRYAVVKNTRKRAMRVLDTKEEAEAFMLENGGDGIELRPPKDDRFIQVLKGIDTVDIYSYHDVYGYLEQIPAWVRYCKRYLNDL